MRTLSRSKRYTPLASLLAFWLAYSAANPRTAAARPSTTAAAPTATPTARFYIACRLAASLRSRALSVSGAPVLGEG